MGKGASVTSVTLTSTGDAQSAAVGSYPIVPSNAVGTGLSNYTIVYDNGTLTVTPATLTITANNASKTDGTALTLAGTAFTETGLVTEGQWRYNFGRHIDKRGHSRFSDCRKLSHCPQRPLARD